MIKIGRAAIGLQHALKYVFGAENSMTLIYLWYWSIILLYKRKNEEESL